ncbi:MAG: hypothetical protein WCK57_07615 [Verrucomicrobiae bacterium]
MTYQHSLGSVRELAFAHNIKSNGEKVEKPRRKAPEVICRHVWKIRLKLQTEPTAYAIRILEKAGF